VAKTERTEAVDPRPDDYLDLLGKKVSQPEITAAEAEAKAKRLAEIETEISAKAKRLAEIDAEIDANARDLSYDMNVVHAQYNNFFSQYDNNNKRSKQHGIKSETEIQKRSLNAFFEQANINPESEKAHNISYMVDQIHDLAETKNVSFKVATEMFLSISKEEFERNKSKK